MKFLIPFLIFFSTQATAQSNLTGCAAFEDLARTIMTARQNGLPLRTIMELVPEGEGSDLVSEIVMSAYEHPQYSSPQMQYETINEFANMNYLLCLRASA